MSCKAWLLRFRRLLLGGFSTFSEKLSSCRLRSTGRSSGVENLDSILAATKALEETQVKLQQLRLFKHIIDSRKLFVYKLTKYQEEIPMSLASPCTNFFSP